MHPSEEWALRRPHNTPEAILKLAELFGFVVDTDANGQLVLFTNVKARPSREVPHG